MRFNILVLSGILFQQDSNAWAPAISPLATRRAVSTSRPNSGLYVSPSIDDKSKEETEDSVSAAFLETETKIWGQPIPYSELSIGVLKETFKGENRVSQVSRNHCQLSIARHAHGLVLC
jgi:hypothetical protein